MPSPRIDRAARPAGPAPDHASLHEAALQHLARFAATEAGLIRVLDRRIARWLRASGEQKEAAGPAYAAAREVARSLAGAGAVDDAAFAASRARRLLRGGRSRRAMAAHLVAKGVDPALADSVLPSPDAEFLAALVYVRRRRLGAFGAETGGPERQRQLAALARAGFPRELAERALRTGREEAEDLLSALKTG